MKTKIETQKVQTETKTATFTEEDLEAILRAYLSKNHGPEWEHAKIEWDIGVQGHLAIIRECKLTCTTERRS